jgi:hypothetical protein
LFEVFASTSTHLSSVTSPLSLLIYPMKKNIGREGTRGKS